MSRKTLTHRFWGDFELIGDVSAEAEERAYDVLDGRERDYKRAERRKVLEAITSLAIYATAAAMIAWLVGRFT